MRAYAVTFAAQTIATASGDYDLFEIQPADDKPVRLLGIFLGQTTELGDTAEEQLRWAVIRGNATGGNGSSATPIPLAATDQAAGFAAETVASTPASTGTPLTLHEDTFNVRAGLQHWWIPEAAPECSQASTMIVVRLQAAVADDLTLSGTLYVAELG